MSPETSLPLAAPIVGSDPAEPAWGRDGLAAAVVQDGGDGRVLMLGWMDAEAYDATRRTGEVHFHSRARGRLWRKGETSGHVLHVERLTLDCDRDAILVQVAASGPTCHTGTRSCFDPGLAPALAPVVATVQGFAWLEQLWATVASRAASRPVGSYTTSLLDGGVDVAARKVAEEATEVLLAAKDDAVAESKGADRTATREAVELVIEAKDDDIYAFKSEAADLLYHALVLFAERGLEPGAVIEALRARHARQPQAEAAAPARRTAQSRC